MDDYIKFCVTASLKRKAKLMRDMGINVSQLLRNYLESYPVEEKSENVA